MISFNIQKMKLFILQKRYSDICNSVKNLQSHISNLYKNNFIDYNERNIVLSNLLEISKNINSKYNEFINVEVDSVDETESSDISGDDKDNVIYNNLDKLNEYFKNIPDSNILDIESKPLEEFTISINKLIEKYGYGKLFDTLNAYIGEIKVNLIDETDTLFLKDIHSLITVISIQQIDISDYNIDFGHKNYKFEIPNKFKNNDYLEMERYLFIKINKYIIRVGFLFNNDLVNINLKSSQINSPYLYNKKNEIVAYIEENNKEVNDKFLKQFLRYDYLGNIYCMTIKEYNEYYNNQYSEFIEIVNHTILNLMKEFLSKSTELKKMFNIIFLLLLGYEENNDIAGILLGLLKEKKNQTKSIYNLFYDNLGYYLQIKLKRSSVSIKNQIDKVKSISIEDVDYTKQLVTNKSIPANVKTLAMEKIEEMKSFNNEYFKQLTFVKHILNYPWS